MFPWQLRAQRFQGTGEFTQSLDPTHTFKNTKRKLANYIEYNADIRDHIAKYFQILADFS